MTNRNYVLESGNVGLTGVPLTVGEMKNDFCTLLVRLLGCINIFAELIDAHDIIDGTNNRFGVRTEELCQKVKVT